MDKIYIVPLPFLANTLLSSISNPEFTLYSFAKENGSVSGPWQVKAGHRDNQVIIEEAIDLTPYTGTQAARTLFSFGAEEKGSTLARVTDIRPRGSQVEISAVAEHTQVHTVDIIKN